jgi:hypothetical protein
VVASGVRIDTLGAPSFALDPAGYPHIAYGRNRLFHTWFDGAQWHSETVDAARAWHVQSVLAIDAAGVITIAHIRDGRVFVRTLEPGGSWQTAEIPLPYLDGAECLSLALDSRGRPHLVAGPESYFGQALFVYAHMTSQGWTAEAVRTKYPAGGPLSIALDSQDQPVVLYGQYNEFISMDELQIARRQGGIWRHKQVAAGFVIVGKSLVMDGQDKAHAVYSDHAGGGLTYVRELDDGWESIPIADGGVYPGLALDSAERPHVVYGDSFSDRQVYATLSGSGWQETTVQEGEYAGWYNTLLLDEAGAAHVVSLATNLTYATNRSGRWLVSTPARQEHVGFHNALDLDSAGEPHILYHNSATQELLLRSVGAGGWHSELVARVSPVDLDVAIAVDAQDNEHIAYIDGLKDRLVVGLRQGGELSLEPISHGGRHLALVVGSDSASPQLILDQNGTLVYWTKEGGDWRSEAVSEPDSGILNARLVLDSSNRPHVIYTAESGSAYAVRQSAGNWVTERLPFEFVEDLALGAGDKPYILHTAYVEGEGGGPKYPPDFYYELRLAERAGVGWKEEPLWIDAGRARLLVGTDNRLHVAFGGYLQRDENGDWLFETPVWISAGDIGLVLGKDGQPRMLTFDGDSLVLSTREIAWLNKFSLMPVVAR